jgi:hypothetical protein
MGLHPVRVALDAEKALLAELEEKFSQFPVELHKLLDLMCRLKPMQLELDAARLNLKLEQSCATDTTQSQSNIDSAIKDVSLTERMLEITQQEINLRKRGLSDEMIENFSRMQVTVQEARSKLKQLEGELMDVEAAIYAARRQRAARHEAIARIGPGSVDASTPPSLARRFTIVRSRWN